MKEQGIIIYPDGNYQLFGQHVCTDQPEYLNSPSHEASFKNEIVDSFDFKLSGLEYDLEKMLYENAIYLSLNGAILIFNNQLVTTDDTKILGYLPINPTEEQINSLKISLKEKLENIKIKQLYEFQSDDVDDVLEYDSFTEYFDVKNVVRK